MYSCTQLLLSKSLIYKILIDLFRPFFLLLSILSLPSPSFPFFLLGSRIYLSFLYSFLNFFNFLHISIYIHSFNLILLIFLLLSLFYPLTFSHLISIFHLLLILLFFSSPLPLSLLILVSTFSFPFTSLPSASSKSHLLSLLLPIVNHFIFHVS